MSTIIVTLKELQGFYHPLPSPYTPIIPAGTLGRRVAIQEGTGDAMLKFSKGMKTVVVIVKCNDIDASYRIATRSDLA